MRKCRNPKCLYSRNRNDAHFCVKCGTSLIQGEKWELYNSSLYTTVSESEHRQNEKLRAELIEKTNENDRLKSENSQLKSSVSSFESTIRSLRSELSVFRNKKSPWEAFSDHLFGLWKTICRYFDVDKHEWLWMVFLFIFIILLFLGIYRCARPMAEKFEENGKWGLKGKDGNSMVPAMYDYVYRTRNPRYWTLSNGEDKKGLAYYTDNSFVVDDPIYKDAEVGKGSLAALKDQNDKWFLVRKGYIEDTPHDEIQFLSNGNYIIGSEDVGFKLINQISGEVIGTDYNNLRYINDSTLLASRDKENHLLYMIDSSNGKRVSDMFIGSQSDDRWSWTAGINWVTMNEQDRDQGLYTLMSVRGEKLFRTPRNSSIKRYGQKFYYSLDNASTWVLLNEEGKELNRIDCDKLEDFYYGLARFKKGDYYGFINNDCKIIIPAEYTYTDYHFDYSDSIISAIHKNGQIGKLKKDGTFTPDKK